MTYAQYSALVDGHNSHHGARKKRRVETGTVADLAMLAGLRFGSG